MSGELSPYREGAAIVVSLTQGLIGAYRQSRAVSAGRLRLLKIEAEKTVALARISAQGEIARANMQQLIKTLELIDTQPVGSPVVPLLMEELDHLHRALMRHIDAV